MGRISGTYLDQQFLHKEIMRATEHQSNLKYLLQHVLFGVCRKSVAGARSGALFAYDRYSDKYVPIASVDGIGDPQNLILQRGAKLVNEHRLLGESVHRTQVSTYIQCGHTTDGACRSIARF